MRVNFYDARSHRHGCEHVLSRNIQNWTDHSRLRNSQKNISLHFPEEWAPRNDSSHRDIQCEVSGVTFGSTHLQESSSRVVTAVIRIPENVCKYIVPSRHGGTLNSRRAASPLMRLVGGCCPNRTVTCMVFKANDRRKNAFLCISRICRSGNRDYTGMWVRRGSTNLMAGKVVFLRGPLSPIRVVDLMRAEISFISALTNKLDEINLRVERLQEASSVTARKTGGGLFRRRETVFKCFYCGLEGHKQAECRKKRMEECKTNYQPPWGNAASEFSVFRHPSTPSFDRRRVHFHDSAFRDNYAAPRHSANVSQSTSRGRGDVTRFRRNTRNGNLNFRGESRF
ncbi:hypothetical protein TNCV_2606611 [Trichonephila clavipes]|uniref:CCHC-type domain-containing protein n=1 Tax=Trichonephila clavipes TaxID=2585209 RepID=A0A8X6V6U3_TRICX|nr:hypothetical protein TNCV_2606611 [Trichonephila clavipes]